MSPCISRFSWQYERFCQYPHIPIPSLETGPSTWKMNHAPKTWKPETPKSALHAFLNMSGCSGSVFFLNWKIYLKKNSIQHQIHFHSTKNKQTFQAIKISPCFFSLPHKAMPLVPAPHQTVARLLHLQVIRWNLLPPADAEDREAALDLKEAASRCVVWIYMGKGGKVSWVLTGKNWGSSGYTPKKISMRTGNDVKYSICFIFKKPLVVKRVG